MTGRAARSLTGRVLVVLALVAIVPAVTVGAIAIWRARASLETEVVRGNLALIRALGASLDARLQSARRALEIAAGTWADPRTAQTARDADPAPVRRLLRRLRRHEPLLASVAIYDVDGQPIEGDTLPIDATAGAHAFGGYIGDVTFVDGTPRVRVVTQARSRTGELVGVFAAQLDLGFISEALASARLGPGARLLVVDGDGVPVARSDGAPAAGARSLRGVHPAVDRALGSATEGSIEAGGVVSVYRNLATYQSLRGIRWALILDQPAADAYALAHETTRTTVAGVVGALALALVVGFAFATRLTRPLRALAARADAIADRDQPEPKPPIRGPGEIGALAERIEQMAGRIAERARLKDALARGDRLAAVGTMAASIAHEINNPLTTVLGYAKLLQEGKPDDDPDLPGLQLIAEESERMQVKVRALLDYSRSDTAGAPDPDTASCDVNDLVDKTIALVGPVLHKRRIQVHTQLASPLPRVRCDAHSLQQVFVNLANNAADAMADGGELIVATQLGPAAATVHVTFDDTGPGVPDADRDRIFDPFYTTKGAGAGTGLGLAVVRHLVARCGGQVTVEPGARGRGARFRVVLPIEE